MRSSPLRTALLAGAAYDLAVGLAILVGLRWLAEILPIPFPQEPVYARLCGVLLIGLAGFYTTTALTLPGSMPSVVAALAIRLLGGIYLLLVPWTEPEAPRFLAVFGAIDLLFGLWILLTFRDGERGRRAPSRR